jgi:DNA-3-methyladenine glycosylase
MQKLPRSFYDRDTTVVARELLGKHLVHVSRGVERIGRIVEVEAYVGPHDLASHSSRGLTGRTKVMFGPPGHAYVYLIYGMYCCMNVVTEREGHGAAVLLRAIEPVKNVVGRTCGPGLLCNAMRISRRLNAHDLLSEDFYIAAQGGESVGRASLRAVVPTQSTARQEPRPTGGNTAPPQIERITIVKSPRIGVDYAGHWAKRHLRFYIKGNPFVSPQR